MAHQKEPKPYRVEAGTNPRMFGESEYGTFLQQTGAIPPPKRTPIQMNDRPMRKLGPPSPGLGAGMPMPIQAEDQSFVNPGYYGGGTNDPLLLLFLNWLNRRLPNGM